MKRYKCIIFDLDGTILDTEKMNIIPLQRVIKEELNKDVTYESLLKYMAYPGRKTLEYLGIKDIERVYDKWVRYVNEFEYGAELYGGFDKVITYLHEKGILCGIASSKTREQYEIDFPKTGLHKYMKSIMLSDDTENHKPHPEPLLKVAENLNIDPKDCMYIGDTVSDYKATKAAGMDFGLALWGARDISDIKADYEFKKPIDILEVT